MTVSQMGNSWSRVGELNPAPRLNTPMPTSTAWQHWRLQEGSTPDLHKTFQRPAESAYLAHESQECEILSC